MKKILVIGAGAWGTAIANLIAKNSHEVFLSANDQKIIDEINQKNSNQRFLPQIKLSPKIKAIADFSDEIKNVDLVFIVTPSAVVTKIFQKISQIKIKKNCAFVICSKGVDQNSSNLLSDAFEKSTGIKNYAVLSGPNFAIEVAGDVPTIANIAAKNKQLAKKIIAVLNNKNFHAKYFSDPRTAEICGIVKNIIAIGCGLVDELQLGVNVKAALVVKGVAEIQILCKKMKASIDLVNAAGFGDIFLTCSSSKSRNNSLGIELAKEKSFAEIKKETGKTYEGAFSAKAIAKISKNLKLQLILCVAINEIISKKFSASEIRKKIIKAVLE